MDNPTCYEWTESPLFIDTKFMIVRSYNPITILYKHNEHVVAVDVYQEIDRESMSTELFTTLRDNLHVEFAQVMR